MADLPPQVSPEVAGSPAGPRRWDTLGVVVASLIGLLALLVSGYTAYIQRQQVRAQVWPYLVVAYQDPAHRLTVFNKGVGPAIIRGVQVLVDGRPQRDWAGVFGALGLRPGGFGYSTLSGNVLSPGEMVPVLTFPDEATETRFRAAADKRMELRICFCSTLGECTAFVDGPSGGAPGERPAAECGAPRPADTFTD